MRNKIGSELLNAPFPEMIKHLGLGIAEAQYALDQSSIRIAQLMSGFKLDDNGNLVKDETAFIKLSNAADAKSYSLLALGFTPTFYQFVDTVIELKMTISVTKSVETSASLKTASLGINPVKMKITASSVNASFAQKYQYSAEGSSLMRTKLVTVPAPAVLEQRIRELMIEEMRSSVTPSV
ncbi:MAG: hypothetical protein RI894_2522 [Bacteroidota bacterium]|jgi:hypothetical protein